MAAHTPSRASIAVVGTGLGGLTAVSTFRLFGYDVQVYEQATRFARIGAGIQMMPNSMYMAYSAATAMEDAAVLARCLSEAQGEVGSAFARDETHRKPRTSRIQAISSADTWMRGRNDDTSWLYGYDAWSLPLTEPALNPAS